MIASYLCFKVMGVSYRPSELPSMPMLTLDFRLKSSMLLTRMKPKVSSNRLGPSKACLQGLFLSRNGSKLKASLTWFLLPPFCLIQSHGKFNQILIARQDQINEFTIFAPEELLLGACE